MKISCRDNDKTIKAYIGQAPYHNPVPFPSSTLIPSVSNPDKYENMADYDFTCKNCKGVKLIKKTDEKNEPYLKCPQCNSRYSKNFIDKGFSNRGKQPGTLNWDYGSSSNNESQGVRYHTENPNWDTFSGNLGSDYSRPQ